MRSTEKDCAAVHGGQTVVIEGFDWGPAVTKTILSLDRPVAGGCVAPECFAVTETKEWADPRALPPGTRTVVSAPRAVLAAYPCGAEGDPVDGASDRVALELAYGPDAGSPYCSDAVTCHSTLCRPYELAVSLTGRGSLTGADGSAITALTVDPAVDLSAALAPQLKGADLSGSFTGADGRTLRYGSYTPARDGKKHPLVIWLHGAGEGGRDASIPLLGNKVTALYGERFQSVMGGAYVLTPQTPDFWLTYNGGESWRDNPGVPSVYTATLMELIERYVAGNRDIDASRIYIGGCSNGGYMTVNMILTYPDYFAAAYPICEAYRDAGISDEQLRSIRKLPVWFVYAENDAVVPPKDFSAPTIARLRAIGADVHASVFPNVVDTSGRYVKGDGRPYEYIGHCSWLYFFNDECEERGVNMWEWLAGQSR